MFGFLTKKFDKYAKTQVAKTMIRQFWQKAQQGDAFSQWQIGIQYEQGEFGFPKNYAEAAKWYRKAAEQGLAGAQLYLGVFYANGQGVPQDPIEAIKWLELAKNGSEQDRAVATESQEQLIAHLSRDQIAEGKRRAHAFMH